MNAITKSPVILTNEGPEKKIVNIKAYIFSNPDSTLFPITIMPSKIDFPDSGDAIVSEYYISITNKSKQTLLPSLVSFPKSLVTVTLPKTIAAGNFEDGIIKLKDAAMSIAFEKSVTIELNDADHTRFTIPIKRGTMPPPKPLPKGQTAIKK